MDYGSCFELERMEDRNRKLRPNTSESGKPEEKAIIIKCANEAQRDHWLKVINDLICQLSKVAIDLMNPQAAAANRF